MKHLPEGLTGKDLFRYLKENKSLLIAAKKSEMKKADAVSCGYYINSEGKLATKAMEVSEEELDVLERVLIINTTNLLDSHDDVHIPGLWKKSLKDNKSFNLLQEHVMRFDHIIDDEAKAMTKNYLWRELGYDADGYTEALVFLPKIRKERNGFMFDQYRKGYVKNHSVGMHYVKIELCVNEPEDKWYRDEFEAWEKYIDQIINKESAEAQGYFWAVTEAKIIEGSAVVRGSNWITPTLPKSTESQPLPSTATQPQSFDLAKAIAETKFINF